MVQSESVKTAARPARSYEVGVLIKAIDVLEALAWQGPQGLGELSAETKANKASVFRILSTLESRGLVTKDENTRKYSAGPGLLALASAITEGVDLVQVTRPILVRLLEELGETVNLGVLSGNQVQYLAVLESTQQLRMSLTAGATDYLHSTALGKVLLSRTDAQVVRKLLRGNMPAHTSHTITSEAKYIAHLEEVRRLGYATDLEESESGGYCIAVPIESRDGKIIAALSVSAPTARMSLDQIEPTAKVLAIAAAEISRNAGH